MDYVQIVNIKDLIAFNESLMVRIEEAHQAKALKWLNHNVKNAIETYARNCVDSWFTGECPTHDLGITFFHYVTPNDAHKSVIMPIRRIDLFAVDPSLGEAYVMGSALLGLDGWQEYGEAVVHLCEALQASRATMATWDSITVDAARETARLWVKRLQRKQVEGGGTVTEVGQYRGFTLVKLEDEAAYISEGRVMNHCVADYWGQPCAIYSLRQGDNRYATLEIRDNTLIQVRGIANSNPAQHEKGKYISDALFEAYTSRGWKQIVSAFNPNSAPQRAFGGVDPRIVRDYLPNDHRRGLHLFTVPNVILLDSRGEEICHIDELRASASENGMFLTLYSQHPDRHSVAQVLFADSNIRLTARSNALLGVMARARDESEGANVLRALVGCQ